MLNLRPAGAVVCPAGDRKGRYGRLVAPFEPPGDWQPFERNSKHAYRHKGIFKPS
jgi:hypothetical protein